MYVCVWRGGALLLSLRICLCTLEGKTIPLDNLRIGTCTKYNIYQITLLNRKSFVHIVSLRFRKLIEITELLPERLCAKAVCYSLAKLGP